MEVCEFMEAYTVKDMEEALQALDSAIIRSKKAQEKLTVNTSQYTLLKNRMKALNIASSLISNKLEQNDGVNNYTKEDLVKARAPIASLISKSEKAQKKLDQDTWQHKMLNNMLKALYMASHLLSIASDEQEAENGNL